MQRVDQTHSKTVAIVFWEGYLGVAPSILNAITLLIDAGYLVDVLTRQNSEGYAEPDEFSSKVRLLQCRPIFRSGRGTRLYLQLRALKRRRGTTTSSMNEPRAGRLRPAALGVLGFVDRCQFLTFTLRHTLNKRYLAIFGIDTDGLWVATLVARMRGIPVFFWSLELTFLEDCRSIVARLTKRLERWSSRRARITIIQDDRRAGELVTENGATDSRIVLVPNGPLGPPRGGKSQVLQSRLGLPDDTRIVLSVGAIDPQLLAHEISRSAASWSEGWTLVFHERRRRNIEDPYISRVIGEGRGRVQVSLEPVSYRQLDELVCSADVGLVFWDKSLSPNFTLMAGASGKLGQYLKCGLPVVCLDLPGLPELMDTYQCGISVSHVNQIDDALDSIAANYSAFRAGAFRCYQEFYEFGRRFQPVLKELDALAAH